MATLIAAVGLLLFGALLIGCGSDNGDSNGANGSSEAFQPEIVTDEDIEAQEADSAGRGLLEWWQAVQFQDAPVALDRTDPETVSELGRGTLRRFYATRGQGFQGIEVLSATEDGDAASVRAGLLTFRADEETGEKPTEPTDSRPITFTLTRDGDQWLFAQTDYLEPLVENMLRAQREEQQQEEGQAEEQPAE